MFTKFWRLVIALILVVSLAVGITLPAYAISPSPTTLQVNQVDVYENCLETGDMLFWIDYTVQYSSVPTELISTTYIVRLINSSTGLDIRDDVPYPFFNSGYSEGLAAIYFSKADVTSLGITFQPSTNLYYIVISGNPTANWVGGTTIPSSQHYESVNFLWKSSTTIGQNQSIITPDLLAFGNKLDSYWNNLATYQLVIPTVNGGYLITSQGQQYFSAMLPNLSLLVPNGLLTPANSALILVTTHPVSTPFAKSIGSDYAGSTLDLTNAANALHIGGMWLGIILTLGICLFVIMHGTKEVNSYKPFIILTLPLLYVFTRIGWFPMPLTVGLALFSAFSLWYSFFYEKSIS
jgi:hypothetical protein